MSGFARRRLIRPLALLGVLAAATSGLGVVAAAPAVAAPTTITLFDINDFHGRLEPPDETDAGEPIGGAAQLAGMLDALRTPASAFVSAGDNIGASTFVSAIQDDNPTLDALNAMDLAASAVGNHEFDKGAADLTDRVEPRAQFPYLGANVYRGGQRLLDPYSISTVAGVRVGFVGVVTEQTASLVSPAGIQGVTFTDPVAEAEQVAADLKDGDPTNGEADVVVVLAHEGAAKSGDCAAVAADPTFGPFTAMSGDVDAIISAHTHQEYACVIDDPLGNPRPVVQTGSYGVNLGKITLTYDDATGDVTAGTAEVLPVQGYANDPDVEAVVTDAQAQAEVLGREEVGQITASITRATNAEGEEDRGAESPMGNFIADVQLANTSAAGRGGAQIAFMNPGGLRADLLFPASSGGGGDGVVTYSEAFAVQPFANDVVTLTLTGQQIKDALEQQWQPAGASRPVLHLGVSKGFTYGYLPDNAQGQRIVASTMTLDGTPIDLAGTYRVTVNSFLAAGGDNFTAFAGGTDPLTTGDNDLTMLVDFLRQNSPITPDTAPRTAVFTGTPGGGTAPTPGAPGGLPDPNGGGVVALPETGTTPLPLLGLGLLLVVAGAATTWAGARSRRGTHRAV